MKTHYSTLIKNIPHSAVQKKIYGEDVYWAVVKGGHFNHEILYKCNEREDAINHIKLLWEKSKCLNV
jgi:hypothetical protein